MPGPPRRLGPLPGCSSQHGPFTPLATASFSSCPRPRSESTVPDQSFPFLLFCFESLPYSKRDRSLPWVAWVPPKVRLSTNSLLIPGRSRMAESSGSRELPTGPVCRAVCWVVSVRELDAVHSGRAGALGIAAVKRSRTSVECLKTVKLS